MEKKRGFTLVELLVVMAIIAVLISVLLPALSSAREHARSLVCKTNLKSYGQALAVYVEDQRGWFPHPWDALYHHTDNWPRELGFARFPEHEPSGDFWPYLSKQADVNKCPTFLVLAHAYYGNDVFGVGTVIKYTYSMNAYLGCDWGGTKGGIWKENQVERSPATICSWADEAPWLSADSALSGINDTLLVAKHQSWPGGQNGDVFANYHFSKSKDPHRSGVGNAVFLDGHVGEVVPEETFEKCWPLRKYANQL